MNSAKYSLNKEDLISITKGLLIVLAGSALTYISQTVSNTNFGEYTPLVVSVFSVLVNLGRKFLAGEPQ